MAVAAALDDGADGVEVDVRRSADGVLVCCHDPDLGRVAGRGPGLGPVVAAVPWARLRREPLPGGRPARLEEVLDLAAARGAEVVTEVKPVPGPARLTAARALAGLLRERAARGRPDRVTTSSFDPQAALALAGAGSASALLVETPAGVDWGLGVARRGGLQEVHLPAAVLDRDPAAPARAHAAGLRVVLWTLDDPADARRAAGLGVDAVISDDPGALVAARALPPAPGAGLRPGRAALAALT